VPGSTGQRIANAWSGYRLRRRLESIALYASDSNYTEELVHESASHENTTNTLIHR
jgi:hypothetical protein